MAGAEEIDSTGAMVEAFHLPPGIAEKHSNSLFSPCATT